MHELRTIYDVEDALNMYEVSMVSKVNEYYAHEEAKKGR